jgi:hypothetical protein
MPRYYEEAAAAQTASPLTRVGGGGLMRALQTLESLGAGFGKGPQLPVQQNLQSILPQQRALSSVIQNQLELPENYLKPQGTLETIGQRGIETLALSPLFGGAAALQNAPLQTLGKIGAGAATGGIAESIGAPPLVQTIAELLGQKGYGQFVSKDIPRFETYKYKKFAEEPGYLAKQPNVLQTPKLQQAFKNIDRGLRVESDSGVKTAIKEAGQTIENLFAGGKGDVGELLDAKSSLFDQKVNLSRSIKRAAPYLDELRLGIKDSIQDLTKNNPDWFKGLAEARQLVLWEKTPSYLEKGFKWATSVAPRSYLGSSANTVIDKIGKFIATPETAIRLLKIPAVQKYLQELIEAIGTKSPGQMIRIGNNLVKVLDKNKDIIKSKPRYYEEA